jgi:hypothetical protein
VRKLASFIAVAALLATFGATQAFAQSSGNFSATGTGASCAIGVGGAFNGGTAVNVFSSNISTSNGSGVTLSIRPSLVTGLFTDTKISATTLSTASADIGIEVCVTVDGSSAGILPSPCAVYDQRFQQISSNLFSQLSECTQAPTTTACTLDADCAGLGTGFTCSIPTGATTGVCVGPNALCDFELIQSTLAAHSFEFVVPVSKGRPHVVQATWSVIGLPANNTAGSHTASCVGPGIVTVTQYKVFNNSGALLSF